MRYSVLGVVAMAGLSSTAVGQLAFYSVDISTGYDVGASVETLLIPAFEQPSWGGPLEHVEVFFTVSAERRFTATEPVNQEYRLLVQSGFEYDFSIDGASMRNGAFNPEPRGWAIPAGFQSPGPWNQYLAVVSGFLVDQDSPVFSDFLGPDAVELDVDREATSVVLAGPEFFGVEPRSIVDFTVRYYFVPAPSATAAVLLSLGICGRRRRVS